MLYSCPTQTEQSILGEPCTSMAPQAKHQKKSNILTHVYFYGMWILFFLPPVSTQKQDNTEICSRNMKHYVSSSIIFG